MKKLSLILLLVIGASALLGQDVHEHCGDQYILDQLEKQYPGFKKRYDEQYLELIQSKKVTSRKITVSDTAYYYDTIYTLPVVFHVLYNNSQENIHDSLLYNQLEVLNRDFRRLNDDTTRTRQIFKSRAGDARIQFEMAKTDPSGNATNGINRVYTTRTTFYTQLRTEMKSSSSGGVDAWDPKKYLNVWVCDLSFGGQDALLGFAYPPYGHPSWPSNFWATDPYQGVVLHYKITGRNNPLATSQVVQTSRGGRVAVHEVGHFLGLRHIWGDGNASTGCSLDDYIDDTPNQAVRSNFDCNLFINTCNDQGGTQYPDMVENYMDYSAHVCQNMFTRQQIDVMRKSISLYRNDLPSKMEIVERQRIFDTVFYNQFLIYPSQGQSVTFEIPNEGLSMGLVAEGYDMTGKKVLSNLKIIENETRFSTVSLSPGIYVFALRDSAGKVIAKQKILLGKN